jgi:hypothetical protein
LGYDFNTILNLIVESEFHLINLSVRFSNIIFIYYGVQNFASFFQFGLQTVFCAIASFLGQIQG